MTNVFESSTLSHCAQKEQRIPTINSTVQMKVSCISPHVLVF